MLLKPVGLAAVASLYHFKGEITIMFEWFKKKKEKFTRIKILSRRRSLR